MQPELIDIAPLSDTIEVRGHTINVRGLDWPHVAALIIRFPELRSLTKQGVGASEVLTLSTDIIAAIIASAAPQLSEASAKNLTMDEKALILEPVVRMTMPRGFGPFVTTVVKLLGTLPS